MTSCSLRGARVRRPRLPISRWARLASALGGSVATGLGALVVAGTPLLGQELPGMPPGMPSFEEVISLRRVDGVAISPDGAAVAYTVRSTDWEKNRYDTEIWLAPADGPLFQLTRTAEGSSSSPAWSPDGRWLAFFADRGEETQVFLIDPRGGEAWALTEVEQGVQSLRWSPGGGRMALRIQEPESDTEKAVDEKYGGFEVEDTEWRNSHLWVVEISDDGTASEPERLTEGDFHVADFAWSPNGERIAIVRQPSSQLLSFMESDIDILEVASRELRPLVAGEGPDASPRWSPDGEWILFAESPGDPGSLFYENGELAKIPAAGGEITTLTEGFDEDPSGATWTGAGIRFRAGARTERKLYALDAETGAVTPLAMPGPIVGSWDFTSDGRSLAVTVEGPESLPEVYRVWGMETAGAGPGGSGRGPGSAREGSRGVRPEHVKLTDMTAQVDFPVGTREVITWASEDGTEIEGVLFKPEGYDPSLRYPLLIQIHGGPTATSRPTMVPFGVYPSVHWLAKGALVLRPNYRGSAAYGEAFRSLNVRNLGVGDMWDVISGVGHLVEAGVAHPDSLGAMGWSQGGYISAFLATNTDAFRAISVGAGISDWMTYYVSTDIHPFTRQYLKGTPWDDPEIYARTSPITTIARATTPTLIQHGEFDRRVPISNAYELYQGLRDRGVETKLIVYKGFRHGINKPKELLAAAWHNWAWFGKHIWGEEIELPVKLEEKKEGEKTAATGIH